MDALFFNPNIYPIQEERKRWNALCGWSERVGLQAMRISVPHEDWVARVSDDPVSPGRCRLCYEMRLDKVARFAGDKGYDCFTTTLLVSPFQDHKGIIQAMNKVSESAAIPYLYQDFRVGYKRGREMARGSHMYMQKYCGCEFSLGRSD